MKHHNKLCRHLLMAIGFAVFLSSCVSFKRSAENLNSADKPQMQIMLIEAYQGIKDGNVESVHLPVGSAFITIRMCVENLSAIQESVYQKDLFMDLGDNIEIHPVAIGYDQAEAFSWLLPIAAPIGAKRIDHKFYFFLIQKSELLTIPAHQSLGCSTSAQFKSLAFLFIMQKENVGQPHILRFLGARMPFAAKKVSPLDDYLKWGAGLGLILILVVVSGMIVRKKKSKVQAPVVVVDEEKSE